MIQTNIEPHYPNTRMHYHELSLTI